MEEKNYQTLPYPKIRRLMTDGGRLGRQKHIVHGLVEFDVTDARHMVRAYRKTTGGPLSFTAFMISCLGHAVDMNKHMQAYRSWRDQLVIFDDVDVNTMFEVEVDGQKVIRPHILRAVNKKTLGEIHAEIRDFQAGHAVSRESRFIDRFVLLPAFIRRFFLGMLFANPHQLKEMFGTVSLTSVGMFGSGGGWALPVSNSTLQISLGGIDKRPGYCGERIEKREYLSVTISFDHDIVDGAPAARFMQRFKELVEGGWGLELENPKLH